ncbi:MAG: tRNA (adenosine(37)-N6)-threonylcarbamoyltransferase complex transferase subunit TsaD [Akkermansiaceae bacterium]
MPANILAIESSCDETAVAILRHDAGQVEVLASEISSQIDIHREFGGVVPELASRNHSLQLRPLVDTALAHANLSVADIDAFAATRGPGLASSLLVGNTAAKALAVAIGKPYIAVNHMEGHLLSPFLGQPDQQETLRPNLALIVSGGHTLLIHMRDFGDYQLLGSTRDDAAGEAFDKVGKMLGLPYPGGPEIEKQARQGSPTAFHFPRSMMKDGLDFSFSGLKTAVLYQLEKLDPSAGQAPADAIPDLCASFQQAVIDVLVTKTLLAADQCGETLITLSGGVSCNQALRTAMENACQESGKTLLISPPALSTDNAAMIAYTAVQSHLRQQYSPLSEDIDPNLSLVHS